MVNTNQNQNTNIQLWPYKVQSHRLLTYIVWVDQFFVHTLVILA